MPLGLRSYLVLVVQVSLLMAISIAYDVPAAALISVAAASLMVAHARIQAGREPRLLPSELPARAAVADLTNMSRRLAHEAELSKLPRPAVIPGIPTLFVLRTQTPRLVMSAGLLHAYMSGQLRRDQVEPLIAHEIAHLTDITSLWGDVLTMSVRLTVVAGLIGLPLSVVVPGSAMTSGEMLLDLGVAFGALIINGLLFGSWRRMRELRADLGGASLLGSRGRHRLARALRAYVHHELAETINRIVLLDRPAIAASARKQLVGNTVALGVEGADLHPLTASLIDLAEQHNERWSDAIWRGSRKLQQIAMRGGNSHPSLANRLRHLERDAIDRADPAPTVPQQ